MLMLMLMLMFMFMLMLMLAFKIRWVWTLLRWTAQRRGTITNRKKTTNAIEVEEETSTSDGRQILLTESYL